MPSKLIAVTMGDAAGVGPELCLRLMASPEIAAPCVPVIFGDDAVLRRVAGVCGLPVPDRVLRQDEWRAACTAIAKSAILDFHALDAPGVVPGRVAAACGRAAFDCIAAAIEAAVAGEVAAVVTNPINKEALAAAGLPYPGHTEIFAERTASPRFCMLQTSERISVSFVTTHVAYADVPRLLTPERIGDVIDLTAAALRRLRGRPVRLGVCGLNPHAGEHGLFGDEEERAIRPAVDAARRRGLQIAGPLPPDTVFTPARLREFDAVVCMYHDQGHIPLKMLAFDAAVNVTLGLPIVRTSVDHGTAFDIAWKGVANPGSLFEAVRLAVRLSAPAGA